MAQDIKVKVRLDDDEFKNNLSEDAQSLNGFGDSVKNASAKMNE